MSPQLHGAVNGGGSGNNAHNYGVGGTAGLGSVVYRSDNGRHSVGVGATAGGSFGRSHGYRWAGPSTNNTATGERVIPAVSRLQLRWRTC